MLRTSIYYKNFWTYRYTLEVCLTDTSSSAESENDDPDRAGEGQPPSSILGRFEPKAEAKDLAREVWTSRGYVTG